MRQPHDGHTLVVRSEGLYCRTCSRPVLEADKPTNAISASQT